MHKRSQALLNIRAQASLTLGACLPQDRHTLAELVCRAEAAAELAPSPSTARIIAASKLEKARAPDELSDDAFPRRVRFRPSAADALAWQALSSGAAPADRQQQPPAHAGVEGAASTPAGDEAGCARQRSVSFRPEATVHLVEVDRLQPGGCRARARGGGHLLNGTRALVAAQ